MAPAAHTSETPDNGNAANGAALTLGVRFMVDEELDVGAVSFFAPLTNSGTYTAGLWETTNEDDPGPGTGDLIESGSLSSASVAAGEWNDITLDAPVTCSPGVIYTAGVHTSSGQFVLTTGVFTSGSITGNGVTLLQAGSDPNPPGLGTMRNGVFTENAALAYPVTATGSDYFIDVALAADSATGELAATLPALTTATAGSSTSDGALTATLPALAASLAADPSSAGTVTATLPALAASLAATGSADATLTATLPALAAAFADTVTAAARSTPAVTVAYTSSTAVTAGRTSQPAVSARRTSTATVG